MMTLNDFKYNDVKLSGFRESWSIGIFGIGPHLSVFSKTVYYGRNNELNRYAWRVTDGTYTLETCYNHATPESALNELLDCNNPVVTNAIELLEEQEIK